MTGLSEQLQSILSAVDIEGSLGTQLGSITGAASVIVGFINDPPEEINGLESGISNLDLSRIRLPDNLSSEFSGLSDLIPSNLGSVTGVLNQALEGISGSIDSNALTAVQNFIECLTRLSVLLETDFSGFSFSTPPSLSAGPLPDINLDINPDIDPAIDRDSPEPGTPENSRALESVKNISALVDQLPSPFNAQNSIEFCRDLLKGLPRESTRMAHVPIYDDLYGLLNMAAALPAMDAAGLTTHIQTTLAQVSDTLYREGLKPVYRLSEKAGELILAADLASLESQAAALSTALDQIVSAVDSGDISGIDANLTQADAALDSLLPLLTTLQTQVKGKQAAHITLQLSTLSRDLNQAMFGLQKKFTPPSLDPVLNQVTPLIEQAVAGSGIQELTRVAAQLSRQIIDILSLLDASVIKTPLQAIADGLDTALDAFDSAMRQVTGNVSTLFDGVNQALDQVDTEALQQNIISTLEEIQNTLETIINTLFEPVRQVISTAVGQIETAVNAFDPETVKSAIEDVINQVTAIFSTPEVQNAVNLIKSTIETITEQLQNASFTPLVDGVVTGVDGVKDVLETVPVDLLGDTLKQQLQAAINALPQDLQPVIDSLTSELDELIDGGPKPLILRMQKPVASLAEELNSISPDKLVGNDLFEAYEELLIDLQDFTPGSLLSPIRDALDGLGEDIRSQIDLASLLAPLEALYNELVSQIDQLDPAGIMDPVNEQIDSVKESFFEILPDEAVFEVLDKVISGVETASAFVTEAKNLTDTLRRMKDELADPEEQLTQWLQPVLDQVRALPDIPGLDAVLGQISDRTNALKKTDLTTEINQALSPLQTHLNTLYPQVLQNRLADIHGRIRSGLTSLPDTAQKTALQALMDRFNPVSPLFAGSLGTLELIRTQIQTTLDQTDTTLADWDDRFFGSTSPLAALQVETPGTGAVKTLMEDSIQNHIIKPAASLLKTVTAVASVLDGPLNELDNLVDVVDDLVTGIVDSPGSLGDIRDSLNQMLERIQGLSLDFLQAELDALFSTVKQKFDNINPRVLRQTLETELNDTLDLLDMEQVLPQSEIQAIDTTYSQAITKLQALNPDTLITQVVQPLFEERIQPLLKLFDLTEPIEVLIDRMDTLALELNTELGRVNTAYQNMLQAVPI